MGSFWKDEKVVATLAASERGQSGTLIGGGARNRMDTANPPQLQVTAEHYNRIARLIEHNVPVKLMFDIKTQFDTANTDSFNVIGEIRGASKPDEVVMLGGHFDSWHYGTGATDNGAGAGVDHGGRPHSESPAPEDGPHRAHGAVGRGRGRPARLARLRQGALRRSRSHEAHRRTREARRLLQYRQRHRPHPRRLSARQ